MTIIMGNISQAATTKTRNVNGIPTLVTEFSVAENRGFGDTESTEYWKITLWRERGAKLAPHLTVGRPIYIEGHAKCSGYISKTRDENGNLTVNVNAKGEPIVKAQLEISNPPTVKLIGKKQQADGAEEVFDGVEV
jgi:single-stranded DNA-binding protein